MKQKPSLLRRIVPLLLICVLVIALVLPTRKTADPAAPEPHTPVIRPQQPAEPVPPEPVVQQPEPETPPQVVEIPIEIQDPEVPTISVPDTPVSPPPEPPKPQTDLREASLQAILDRFTAAQSGTWDIHVESLATGAFASTVPEGEPGAEMVSASVIKLFVMAKTYEQIEAGALQHETVYPQIYSMITVSDNYSTNQLIRQLGGGDAQTGMDLVNAYAQSLGCTHTRLNRLMLDDNGLQNYTSAADCARLLRKIYEGTCVTAQWSGEMLDILRAQTIRSRIPAGVPDTAAVANKTGDLVGLCVADVGIVLTEQTDYILCTICNAPTNDYTDTLAIADLSGEIYRYFTE